MPIWLVSYFKFSICLAILPKELKIVINRKIATWALNQKNFNTSLAALEYYTMRSRAEAASNLQQIDTQWYVCCARPPRHQSPGSSVHMQKDAEVRIQDVLNCSSSSIHSSHYCYVDSSLEVRVHGSKMDLAQDMSSHKHVKDSLAFYFCTAGQDPRGSEPRSNLGYDLGYVQPVHK